MISVWHRKFAAIPNDNIAIQLATEVRQLALGPNRAAVGFCDIDAVCKLGGFRVKRFGLANSPGDHEALLVPTDAGNFDILVDPRVTHLRPIADGEPIDLLETHRLRFRVAHEIGHSFFYDRSRRPPSRLLHPSKEEEHFCDQFASALLVPPTALQNLQLTAQSVLALRHEYCVSAEVAARALFRFHPNAIIVGLLWRRNPRDDIEGMRVVWRASSRFVPIGARLPSRAVDLAQTDGKAQLTEELKTGWLRGRFVVDAARLPNGVQVVAVLNNTYLDNQQCHQQIQAQPSLPSIL